MKINYEIAMDILNSLQGEKRNTLVKALNRNFALTSAYVLSSCEIIVYKEGWYIKLRGTRSSFSVFALDNDGEFEIIRKPCKLNYLYTDWVNLNETDFYNFI